MESRNLEVPTATLSGTPIMRLSTGTLAQPAPRPNMPAMTPMMMNMSRPGRVRWVFQAYSLPEEASK